MPRLARHKVTGVWFNDFVRGERPAGDVLANVVRAGLNPAGFEEVEVTFAQYDTEETAFFATARTAETAFQAARETDWANARAKVRGMLDGSNRLASLTVAELREYAKRVLGEG